MTRQQALILINDGVAWAFSEGQGTPELLEACKVLMAEHGINREEVEIKYKLDLPPEK